MGNYTTNLGLYNTNMNTDGNDLFDFQRDLNDNNDILDSAIGKLANLTTTDKQSLVNAINELVTNLGSFATKDLDNLSSLGQAIIDKKVEVEALLAQNGYAKFSWKENNVISNLILQWGGYYNGNGDDWINLPINFNQEMLIAIASPVHNLSYALPNIQTSDFFTNTFRVIVSYNNAISPHYFSWFAIGY